MSKSRKSRKIKSIWFLINMGFRCVDGSVSNDISNISHFTKRKYFGYNDDEMKFIQRHGYTFKLDEAYRNWILSEHPDAPAEFLDRKHFQSWHAIREFVNKWYDKYCM